MTTHAAQMSEQVVIEVTGLSVRVDAVDYHRLRHLYWWVNKKPTGPVVRCQIAPGRNTGLHRLIMNAPVGLVVDHIDGDTLNNTRANLRICRQDQNIKNLRRVQKGSRVGFKGVGIEHGRFLASIRIDGVRKRLGRYENPEDAARAYDVASRQLHGVFGCTNADLGLLQDSPKESRPLSANYPAVTEDAAGVFSKGAVQHHVGGNR